VLQYPAGSVTVSVKLWNDVSAVTLLYIVGFAGSLKRKSGSPLPNSHLYCRPIPFDVLVILTPKGEQPSSVSIT